MTARTVREEVNKIMRTKIWSIAVALLALVLCGTAMFSYAQQNEGAGGEGWSGHGHHHMAWMAKQLNLTDAQKQQIKTIMQTQRAANGPLMQQLAENRKAMLAATANGAFDQAKVQAIATQQSQAMAQLMVQKATIQHQIYTQVLTPEQRTQADQMHEKQMARIDQRLQKLSQPATEAAPQ
jgi:protein CpxP